MPDAYVRLAGKIVCVNDSDLEYYIWEEEDEMFFFEPNQAYASHVLYKQVMYMIENIF